MPLSSWFQLPGVKIRGFSYPQKTAGHAVRGISYRVIGFVVSVTEIRGISYRDSWYQLPTAAKISKNPQFINILLSRRFA
jgi:hypothetical protein